MTFAHGTCLAAPAHTPQLSKYRRMSCIWDSSPSLKGALSSVLLLALWGVRGGAGPPPRPHLGSRRCSSAGSGACEHALGNLWTAQLNMACVPPLSGWRRGAEDSAGQRRRAAAPLPCPSPRGGRRGGGGALAAARAQQQAHPAQLVAGPLWGTGALRPSNALRCSSWAALGTGVVGPLRRHRPSSTLPGSSLGGGGAQGRWGPSSLPGPAALGAVGHGGSGGPVRPHRPSSTLPGSSLGGGGAQGRWGPSSLPGPAALGAVGHGGSGGPVRPHRPSSTLRSSSLGRSSLGLPSTGLPSRGQQQGLGQRCPGPAHRWVVAGCAQARWGPAGRIGHQGRATELVRAHCRTSRALPARRLRRVASLIAE